MATGYIALFGWPVIVAILFQRLPLKSAVIWSIVGGYLLLPSQSFVEVDLPLLPPIDKQLVPGLAAAIFAVLTLRKRAQAQLLQARRGRPVAGPLAEDTGPILDGWMPKSMVGRLLIITMFVGGAMTVLTNRDILVAGPYFIGGLAINDFLSTMANVATVVLVVLIGRKFLSDEESHRRLMRIFCVAAVAYAFLALFEVRMSPRLNIMVYGFFPHAWDQHFRDGGWRPLVFLDHALHLGIFLSYALIGTAAMIRVAEGRRKIAYILAVPWLLLTIYMAKTMGALLIAAALMPAVFFLSVRLQLIAATVIAAVALTYPMLRGADIVPTEEIIEFVEDYNPDRAWSLGYRFDNEDLLLEKANERPLFGWGGQGRSRYYDEEGRDIAIADGVWVIIMGVYGWIGYIGLFGLLTIPVMLLALRKRTYGVGLATSGLCLMLSANLIDLLPNASMSQVCLLMGGALLGRLEAVRVAASDPEEPQTADVPDRRVRSRGKGPARPVADPVADPVAARGPAALPETAEGPTSPYTRFAQNRQRRR